MSRHHFFAAALLFVATTLGAQTPPPKLEPLPEPPPPRSDASDAPRVRIPVREGDEVEEVRDGGRVVMLRVTPKDGPPYYLVDTSGNGNWVRRESTDSGLRVPMWPIRTWD